MPEWLIKLSGQTLDLEVLRLVRSSSWAVEKADGNYYLTSRDFESFTEAADALNAASDLLPLINGAAMALMNGFERVSLDNQVTRRSEGGTESTAIVVRRSRMRIRSSAPTVLISGVPVQKPEYEDMKPTLSLAANNHFVERALALYGSIEHTWRNLFMVLDVIEESCGGERELLAKPWASAKLKRFKATANNWCALGAESRHGIAGWKKPERPMSLDEAQELIRHTLQGWIRSLC